MTPVARSLFAVLRGYAVLGLAMLAVLVWMRPREGT